jgi:hypothetical protein
MTTKYTLSFTVRTDIDPSVLLDVLIDTVNEFVEDASQYDPHSIIADEDSPCVSSVESE